LFFFLPPTNAKQLSKLPDFGMPNRTLRCAGARAVGFWFSTCYVLCLLREIPSEHLGASLGSLFVFCTFQLILAHLRALSNPRLWGTRVAKAIASSWRSANHTSVSTTASSIAGGSKSKRRERFHHLAGTASSKNEFPCTYSTFTLKYLIGPLQPEAARFAVRLSRVPRNSGLPNSRNMALDLQKRHKEQETAQIWSLVPLCKTSNLLEHIQGMKSKPCYLGSIGAESPIGHAKIGPRTPLRRIWP